MVNLVLQQRNSGCAVLKRTARPTADCSSSLRGVLFTDIFLRCIKRCAHGLTVKGDNTTAPNTVYREKCFRSLPRLGRVRWGADRRPRTRGVLLERSIRGEKRPVIQRLFKALWCGGGAWRNHGSEEQSAHLLPAHRLLNHSFKATQLKSGSFRVYCGWSAKSP